MILTFREALQVLLKGCAAQSAGIRKVDVFRRSDGAHKEAHNEAISRIHSFEEYGRSILNLSKNLNLNGKTSVPTLAQAYSTLFARPTASNAAETSQTSSVKGMNLGGD